MNLLLYCVPYYINLHYTKIDLFITCEGGVKLKQTLFPAALKGHGSSRQGSKGRELFCWLILHDVVFKNGNGFECKQK